MIKLDGQVINEKKSVTMVSFYNYKITVKNKDFCQGYYCAEENWSIIVYGQILDDIFKRLAKEFFIEHGEGFIITPENFTAEIVNIISFIDEKTGEIINQFEDEKSVKYYRDAELAHIKDNFYNSSYYKEEQKKYADRVERYKKQQEDKERTEKEEQEKRQLEELLKKYPQKG